MARKYTKNRRKKQKTKKRNNIKLKIKNLAKLKNKVKTRKYKRIQYGCKNMKGGNAMIDITGKISDSIQNNFIQTQNTLGGHNGNEIYKGFIHYPN